MKAPLPDDEEARLAALRSLDILDTGPDPDLDALVTLASRICRTPISLVSLVDEDRQWFKARHGLDIQETPRDVAFCAHAILHDGLFEVRDALVDERFRTNPLVTREPKIRFYAGTPLHSADGHAIGALCVLDRVPRDLDADQRETLSTLARAVAAHLDLRRALAAAAALGKEREKAERELRRATDLLSAVTAISSGALADLDLKAAFEKTLDVLLRVTSSEFGFVGEILRDPDGAPYLKTQALTNIAWNDETRLFYERHATLGMEFGNLATLFGAVMTTGEPVVSNDPRNDLRRGGLPPGHPALRSFLGVPFRTAGELSGMVGVANAPGGYDAETIERIEPILSACGGFIGNIRRERRRRAAEEALSTSERRLRQMLGAAQAGAWEWNLTTGVGFWSEEDYQLLGYEPGSVEPSLDALFARVHPDDRARARETLERAVATASPFECDYRIVHADGVTRWVRDVGNVETDDEGRPLRISGIVTDVTARKTVELRLAETTSRLTALIRNLDAGLLVEDERRMIQLANPGFCRLFGIPEPPERLVGVDGSRSAAGLAEMFEDPKGFLDDIDGTLAARSLVSAAEVRTRDGRVLERDYIPILVEGDYRGHLWQYRDVTGRKRAEKELLDRRDELSAANAELERAARLKDEFLAAMSHELRTPLNAVLGLAEGLAAGVFGSLSDLQAENVAIIEDSGRHLLDLINEILDLSKIGAGKLTLSPAPVNPATVCEAGLRMVREAAMRKRIRLSSRVDPALGTVVADPLRLRQILVNLLGNAVKFTPEGGSVSVEASADVEGGRACFTVRDDGIGIAPEELRRLFKPFVQLDSGLSREHAGTGLGLSLALRLAELHGGGVSVETSPGRGSRFTVALPWSPEEQEEIGDRPQAPEASSQGAGTPSAPLSPGGGPLPLVLVADDHEANVVALRAYLSAAGYRVAVARNGQEAVDQTVELRPDLVLMDVQMPVLDGFEATRRIRGLGERGRIPIVALTALAMTGDRERILAAGADDYISKPVRLARLAALVAGHLRRGHPGRTPAGPPGDTG